MRKGELGFIFGSLLALSAIIFGVYRPDFSSGSFTAQVAPPIIIGEGRLLPIDDSGNGNLLVAQQTTLFQTAMIQSLSFYVSLSAGKLRLGLYDATGPGGGPGQKKAETAEITPVVGWNTASVLSPVSLAPGNYWLAYLSNDNNLHFKLDFTGPAKWYSYAYGVMPQTFSTNPLVGARHWSFYATLNLTTPRPSPILPQP